MTTPADVTGLRLWLKADAITGLSDGAGIATWSDSSGLGNDAVMAVGGFQPTYQTNEVNGLPCARFDGTDDRMDITNANMLAASNNAAGFTAFAYINLSSPSNASRDIYSISNGVDGTAVRIKFGQRAVTLGEWSMSGRRLDADTAQNLVGNQTQTGWQLITVVSDWANDDAFIYRGENTEASTTTWLTAGNTSATNALACHVGSAPSAGSEFWIGDIAELAVYDNAVSTTDRLNLWAYFQAKYAPPAGTPLLNPTFLIRRGLWRPIVSSVESVTADVRNDTAFGTAGLSADVTAKKVAVVFAISSLGLTATPVAKKVSKSTGIGTVGLTSTVTAKKVSTPTASGNVGLAANFVHADVRSVTALATCGLTSTSTAKKVGRPTVSAPIGLAGTSTAKKVSRPTVVGPVGLEGLAVAKKVSTPTALGTVGLAANFVHANIHPITALGGLGLTSIGAAKKVIPATVLAPVGLGGISTTKKVSRPALSTPVGLAGIVTAKKVGKATGLGALGLQAMHSGISPRFITVLGPLGLTSTLAAKKRAIPISMGVLGLTGNALPKKISKSTGAGIVGLEPLAVIRKKQAVTGRSVLGLTAWWEFHLVTLGGDLDIASRQVADLGTGDRRVSGNTAASSGQPNAVTGDRKTTTLTESPRQTSTLTGG
jgi:hypothetical protein